MYVSGLSYFSTVGRGTILIPVPTSAGGTRNEHFAQFYERLTGQLSVTSKFQAL